MALNASAMASTMNQIYTEETNLNIDGSVKYEVDGVTATPPPMPNNFASRLATAYNDYASQGEVASATNEGASPSGIESALAAMDNSPNSVNALGQAFADYYAQVALIPAEPTHGGTTVISVTNDASTKASDFTAAILSTYTTANVSPPMSTFIQNIENAAKSITWFIEEDTGTFEENIS